jgi:Flp pilus assembly protein TadD
MTTARLIQTLLFVLLLAGAPITHAQSDTNLNQLEAAITAINQNQFQQADDLLNSILAKTPNDADALNLLGVVRAKQDRTTDAEKLFRRAITILPAHVSAHINLAELLLTHNRPTEAAVVLLRAYKLAPTRPEINIDLGTLYAAKDDYQRAYVHLQQVPRDAFNDDYFLAMLRSLIGLKQSKEIPELAHDFENSTIESDETKAQFASLLVKAGLYDEAFKILNAAVQTSKSFSLLYALGIANIATKQFDKAGESLTEALKLKPADVATLRALAQAARNTGNFEKALSYLVQARRIAPNSPAVLYDFGVTTLQMNLVLDALPVFEQLHRDHPREPAYLYGLAAAHWTKGDVAETTGLLNTYLALEPKSPVGWYLLGAALLRQERYPEAQRALQRSLTLKADVDTEYLLGVSLEKTGNRNVAIETFQKIVKARPDHAAAHAALGAAYRENSNYTDARTELERALQLDANDLRANYQLGLVYAKLGEKEAAQKMFDRADELRKLQHNEERVILKLIEEPQR